MAFPFISAIKFPDWYLHFELKIKKHIPGDRKKSNLWPQKKSLIICTFILAPKIVWSKLTPKSIFFNIGYRHILVFNWPQQFYSLKYWPPAFLPNFPTSTLYSQLGPLKFSSNMGPQQVLVKNGPRTAFFPLKILPVTFFFKIRV